MHGNIDKLLLNATAVSDFKTLYNESTPCLVSAKSQKTIQPFSKEGEVSQKPEIAL